MASMVGLAVGLGLVFGCLMLALAAELYYLLCWRNRSPKRDVEIEGDIKIRHGTDVPKLNCLKKPTVLNSHSTTGVVIPATAVNGQDSEFDTVKEPPSTSISDDDEEIGLDTELMKLHGLAGPPRFLFTIKEESREDLADSDDGRSGKGSRSRARSMSDILVGDTDFEFGFPVKSTSPPPKFKFLRDAEEKFYWKQKVERSAQVIPLPFTDDEDEKLACSVH